MSKESSLDGLKVGHVYLVEKLGDKTVLVGKGEYARLIESDKAWGLVLEEKLFWCDECIYFSTSAAAVQEHSEREHNCRFETYYSVDSRGAQHVRVRTIKCHPRLTVKGNEMKPHAQW